MADNDSPDSLRLATLRYVEECVSCPVIVGFPFELTQAELESVKRYKSIKGVVSAAGNSEQLSVDRWQGYYWPDPSKWLLPQANAQKIVFAGPWWLLSMQMIGESRNAGVRSIVHRSWGRWWDTPLVLLVGMKLARRFFWELWHLPVRGWHLARAPGSMASGVSTPLLQRIVLAAARVELIRRVAKRLARNHLARRLLRVLEAWFYPRAAPAPELFREAIAGAGKADVFIPGRIVMVCGNLSPGGAERQVVNTLLELQQYEFESVRLLCDFLTPNHAEKYDFFLPRLRQAGIEAREISARKTRWFSRHGGVPKALASIAPLLPPRLVHDITNLYWEFRELKPEVVHAWLDWSNVRAGIAAAMAGVPRIVLSCRNLNPSHFDLYQNYMDPIYEALAELPNVILVNNSHAGANDYARWLSLPKSRIQIIYNGIHCESHRRASDREIAGFREGLGVPPGIAVVGSAFRFHPEKRPLLWIESAAAIAAKHPNVQFVVFGQGPMRDEMLDRARELEIADSITLPGITAEIDLALSSMDVLLLTSSGEGTPNVALEAQSVGTPVVANDAGGMKEAVETDVTGWIVEEPDPQAIAERVVGVLSDPAARPSARQAGPAFVSHRFGLQRMVSETLLAYGIKPVSVRLQPLATPSEDRLADELAQHLKRLPGTPTYTKLLERSKAGVHFRLNRIKTGFTRRWLERPRWLQISTPRQDRLANEIGLYFRHLASTATYTKLLERSKAGVHFRLNRIKAGFTRRWLERPRWLQISTSRQDRLANEIALYLRHLPSTATYTKLLELKEFSMLHWEALAILRLLVKRSRGPILEIGPYLGAATIAMAQALKTNERAIVTVEKGGAYVHQEISSRDIFADLERNLERYHVQDKVVLIKGHCADPNTINEVKELIGDSKIGLIMIDADGNVSRDIENFAQFADRHCYLVIDDYTSPTNPGVDAKEKSVRIKPYIDRMVAEGKMRQIGIYRWGTWVGQLVDNRF